MKRTTIRILFMILQIALLMLFSCQSTPNLHELVKDGTPEAVREALSAEVDVNAGDRWGTTAFMTAAAWNENPADIQVVLEAGANVNSQDKWGDAWRYHSSSKSSSDQD